MKDWESIFIIDKNTQLKNKTQKTKMNEKHPHLRTPGNQNSKYREKPRCEEGNNRSKAKSSKNTNAKDQELVCNQHKSPSICATSNPTHIESRTPRGSKQLLRSEDTDFMSDRDTTSTG